MTDHFHELRITLDIIKETQHAIMNHEEDNHDPICGECGRNLNEMSFSVFGCDNPECWNYQTAVKALWNGRPFTTYVRI